MTSGRGGAASRREQVHAQWQQVGTADRVLSTLDLARTVSRHAGSIFPLVRALCVEEVYLEPTGDGTVASSSADGVRYVHAFTSPARLAATLSVRDDRISMQAVLLPDALGRLPEGVGVRLDPGTEAEVVLEPDVVRLLRATAAGIPTPAALTAVEGEELRFATGPDEVTALDRAVRGAVPGRVQRYVADLDGVGGRTWPVYRVDGSGLELLDAVDRVEQAAGAPVVTVVDGQPAWLAALVEPGMQQAFDVPV